MIQYTYLKTDRVANLRSKLRVVANGKEHIHKIEDVPKAYIDNIKRFSRIAELLHPNWTEMQFVHNHELITITRS